MDQGLLLVLRSILPAVGVEKGSATLLCLSQEYDPSKATFVKVVPTSNNGSTELVALHRDEVGTT